MTTLSQIAHAKEIRYFLISFTDLFGVQRSKLVPAESIDQMAVNGAGFAGFAAWLDLTPADPDILAIPDPESLIQLRHSARSQIQRSTPTSGSMLPSQLQVQLGHPILSVILATIALIQSASQMPGDLNFACQMALPIPTYYLRH
jgi:hypothetical protein